MVSQYSQADALSRVGVEEQTLPIDDDDIPCFFLEKNPSYDWLLEDSVDDLLVVDGGDPDNVFFAPISPE